MNSLVNNSTDLVIDNKVFLKMTYWAPGSSGHFLTIFIQKQTSLNINRYIEHVDNVHCCSHKHLKTFRQKGFCQ